MKPDYDLNKLIKNHQEKAKQRFPGDSAHIREGVSVSMQKKVRQPPGDSAKVRDHVSVSLQNK